MKLGQDIYRSTSMRLVNDKMGNGILSPVSRCVENLVSDNFNSGIWDKVYTDIFRNTWMEVGRNIRQVLNPEDTL